jgi:Ca-activated chloride channel family protein
VGYGYPVSTRAIGRGPAFIKPRGKFRKWLPVLLLLGAVGCLVGAFLQFRLSQEVRQATVILVMDASDSMLKTDVEPDRLTAAQAAAALFLQEVPKDFRVGFVTFGGTTEVRVTPTVDRTSVENSLDSLTTTRGTLLGDGLVTALESLKQDWEANGEGPSAVLLLTDGIDTGSEDAPLVAAEQATRLEVPVFTVLLGEEQIQRGKELLSDIAKETGGRTFNAETADELNTVYENLGSTLSVQLAVTDIGIPFLIGAGALGLLAGVALVRSTDTTDWR